MPAGGTRVVVADASVLINLMHADHLGLLGELPGYEFVVPEEVDGEIKRPEQRARLEGAMEDGTLTPMRMDQPAELGVYAELRELLDKGESACLALAASHGWLVACDERRAFLAEANRRLGKGKVLNTPGLYLLFIHNEFLTVAQADEAKATLERHRFKMPFHSFGDLMK